MILNLITSAHTLKTAVGLAGQWASTITKYSILNGNYPSSPYHLPHSCRLDKSQNHSIN